MPTVFTRDRERLIEHDAVVAFFNAVLKQADKKRWLSKEHFSVNGSTDRKFNRMRPSMARVLGLETRSAKEG